jgi:hypothetical protein
VKKPARCAYAERGQRCRRKGDGNPPLCDAHRIVLEAEAARPARPGEKIVGLLGRVFRGQKVSDDHLYAGIEDFVDMFSRAPHDPPHNPVDAARARAREFFRKSQGVPPPPQRPKKPAGPDPRVVLGFAIGQKITAAEVKARHRELARKHHPDRGGSVAKMQEVNAAVDQLLATL